MNKQWTAQPPALFHRDARYPVFHCDPRHGKHGTGTLRWMLRAVRGLAPLHEIVDPHEPWCFDVEAGTMHKRPTDWYPRWQVDEGGRRLTVGRRWFCASYQMPTPGCLGSTAEALIRCSKAFNAPKETT